MRMLKKLNKWRLPLPIHTWQRITDNRSVLVTLYHNPRNWVLGLGVSHTRTPMLPITLTALRTLCFKLEIEIHQLGE